MSDFLYNLGQMIDTQVGASENSIRSLDKTLPDGTTQKYGKLGDFSNKFDQSAIRQYTEEGFNRTNKNNVYAKNLEILNQEPDASVLIKKRAFSTLSENFRPDLMDADEKSFYKTSKVLFQNKCQQISNYEKLSKIEKISTGLGYIDDALFPIIVNVGETLSSSDPNVNNGSLSKFRQALIKIKQSKIYSERKIHTNWVSDLSLSFVNSQFGQGTGVIELTSFTSFSTNIGMSLGTGNCSLNISDPYQIMRINENDIEKAIADATNYLNNNSLFQIGIPSIESSINTNKILLNSLRSNRGSSPLNFIVQPDTILGKKIRVLISRTGTEIIYDESSFNSFNLSNSFGDFIDSSSKFGSEVNGNEGLKDNEIKIFGEIISSIYKMLNLINSANTNAKVNNQKTNYIRKKLMLHYCDKLLIQPMDTIHIYIGSKSKTDEKIIGGLKNTFTQQGFLNSMDSNISNLKTLFNVNDFQTMEKSIFVGSDFPSYLWPVFRNNFVNSKNGTHVFAGVVTSARSSFDSSSGRYAVSVSCSDNSYYFDNGVVNFKPSVDVFNGPLFDPLTPFDMKFDSITGVQKDSNLKLLQENETLLSGNPNFIKYKAGRQKGATINKDNYENDRDRNPNLEISKVYYDPDGFVYRWKEGIGTFVLFGDNYSDKSNNVITPLGLTNDPFAGQDIMNIISLLITGEPYNFASFYKGATEFDSFGKDPLTKEDSSVSFFKFLKDQLSKRNYLYGNFIPFKKLVMDEQSYTQILNNQLTYLTSNDQLTSLLQQRAELSDKILQIGGRSATTPTAQGAINDVAGKIANIDSQIEKLQQSVISASKTNPNYITIAGNDISYNTDGLLNNQTLGSTLNDPSLRQEIRRKTNYLTQRLYWQVKGNEDRNLFIVDDIYDKDYDIQIIEKTFSSNQKTFDSDYSSVSDKIKQVSEKMQMEVFADSQGHIQARFPQYNRMPSSVFYKMLRLKQEKGIQIYPQFLEDLSVSQIDTLIKNIEVNEDFIRLNCAFLGTATDADCEQFIKGNASLGGDATFKFLTNDDSKNGYSSILGTNISLIDIFADPNKQSDSILTKLSPIEDQNKPSNTFNVAQQANIALGALTVTKMAPTPSSTNTEYYSVYSDSTFLGYTTNSSAADRVLKIKQRLLSKTGQSINTDNYDKTTISNMDIFKIIEEISQKIAERQKLIKAASGAIKNIKEAIGLDQNKDNVVNKLLYPNLFGTSGIPETLEHMIEDESYDDLGPGSGQRFIIKDSHIKNIEYREEAPKYTAISLTGSYGDLFVPQSSLPSDLNAFQGGNALTSVMAVDYDLWRMYGVKMPVHIDAPFITNPETQGAPYAVALLNRQRADIIKADVTTIGNEYYQVGEVYFVESLNLLFYCENVSHSFSQGAGFSTTLRLTYGHHPGEYIPTSIDLIGKVFYKSKDTSNFINYRQDHLDNQHHLGIIVGDVSGSSEFFYSDGPYADQNMRMLKNIIPAAASLMASNSGTLNLKLEIRYYYNSKNAIFTNPSDYTKYIAEKLKQLFIGTLSIPDFDSKGITLNEADINVLAVDIAKSDEFRYASGKAYNEARNIASNHSTVNVTKTVNIPEAQSGIEDPFTTQDQVNKNAIDQVSSNNTLDLDKIIYGYIVDCWVAPGV